MAADINRRVVLRLVTKLDETEQRKVNDLVNTLDMLGTKISNINDVLGKFPEKMKGLTDVADALKIIKDASNQTILIKSQISPEVAELMKMSKDGLKLKVELEGPATDVVNKMINRAARKADKAARAASGEGESMPPPPGSQVGGGERTSVGFSKNKEREYTEEEKEQLYKYRDQMQTWGIQSADYIKYPLEELQGIINRMAELLSGGREPTEAFRFIRASDNKVEMEKIEKGYASGSDYITHDQLAYIHKGEAVIPAKTNSELRDLYDNVQKYDKGTDAKELENLIKLLKLYSNLDEVYGRIDTHVNMEDFALSLTKPLSKLSNITSRANFANYAGISAEGMPTDPTGARDYLSYRGGLALAGMPGATQYIKMTEQLIKVIEEAIKSMNEWKDESQAQYNEPYTGRGITPGGLPTHGGGYGMPTKEEWGSIISNDIRFPTLSQFGGDQDLMLKGMQEYNNELERQPTLFERIKKAFSPENLQATSDKWTKGLQDTSFWVGKNIFGLDAQKNTLKNVVGEMRKFTTSLLITFHVIRIFGMWSQTVNKSVDMLTKSFGLLIDVVLLPLLPFFVAVSRVFQILAMVIMSLPAPARYFIALMGLLAISIISLGSLWLPSLIMKFARWIGMIPQAIEGLSKFAGAIERVANAGLLGSSYVEMVERTPRFMPPKIYSNPMPYHNPPVNYHNEFNEKAGDTSELLAFAMGGPLKLGQTALVGENGPELLIPTSGGFHVVPNLRKLAGGTGLSDTLSGGFADFITGGVSAVAGGIGGMMQDKSVQNVVGSIAVLGSTMGALIAPFAGITAGVAVLTGGILGLMKITRDSGENSVNATVAVGRSQRSILALQLISGLKLLLLFSAVALAVDYMVKNWPRAPVVDTSKLGFLDTIWDKIKGVWDKIAEQLSKVWDKIKEKWDKLADVMEGLKGIFSRDKILEMLGFSEEDRMRQAEWRMGKDNLKATGEEGAKGEIVEGKKGIFGRIADEFLKTMKENAGSYALGGGLIAAKDLVEGDRDPVKIATDVVGGVAFMAVYDTVARKASEMVTTKLGPLAGEAAGGLFGVGGGAMGTAFFESFGQSIEKALTGGNTGIGQTLGFGVGAAQNAPGAAVLLAFESIMDEMKLGQMAAGGKKIGAQFLQNDKENVGTQLINQVTLIGADVRRAFMGDLAGGPDSMLVQGFTAIFSAIRPIILDAVTGIFTNITSVINGMVDLVKNPVGSAMAGASKLVGFAEGGVVGTTGIALVHAGETITPAGQGSGVNIYNPTFIIKGKDEKELFESFMREMKLRGNRRSI